MDLGVEWNHVVRGRRIVKATTLTPNPNPQPVTEAPKQPKVTTTRKTAKLKKLEPKTTAAPKPATVNPKKNAATSVKTVADKPNTSYLVVTPTPYHLPNRGCI